MASKVRIILQTGGDVYFNGRAIRRLEAVARDYGLTPPAELTKRWERARWIFENYQRGGSILQIFRVRRGHSQEQWHAQMRRWGMRRRVTPPPRQRPRPQQNRNRIVGVAQNARPRPIAIPGRSANANASAPTFRPR